MSVDSLTSAMQWLDDVRDAAKLDLYHRLRLLVLDTRQYASREISARTYLRRQDGPKRLRLTRGGEHREAWLDGDFDATKRFPFEDETFDAVFSEHTLEHLSYEQGAYMLRECRRVLKPGGWLRLVTADLDAVLSLMRTDRTERTPIQERYLRFMAEQFVGGLGRSDPIFVVNAALRLSDFTYDGALLGETLHEAGFGEVERAVPGESERALFRGADMRPLPDPEIDRYQSLAFEARRPL